MGRKGNSKHGVSPELMSSSLMWRIVRRIEIYLFSSRALRNLTGDYVARSLEEELLEWEDARDFRRQHLHDWWGAFGTTPPKINCLGNAIATPHSRLTTYGDQLRYRLAEWGGPNGIDLDRLRRHGDPRITARRSRNRYTRAVRKMWPPESW